MLSVNRPNADRLERRTLVPILFIHYLYKYFVSFSAKTFCLPYLVFASNPSFIMTPKTTWPTVLCLQKLAAIWRKRQTSVINLCQCLYCECILAWYWLVTVVIVCYSQQRKYTKAQPHHQAAFPIVYRSIAKLSSSRQLQLQLNWDSIITTCLPTYMWLQDQYMWLQHHNRNSFILQC